MSGVEQDILIKQKFTHILNAVENLKISKNEFIENKKHKKVAPVFSSCW